MNSPDMAKAGRFSSKEQLVVERLCQHLLSFEAIDWKVAIRTETEGIILPIVNV